MHIEPGFVAPAKVVAANVVAAPLVGYYALRMVRQPWMIAKMILAAVFFSLFMESFHMPVGPSELHFVGASAMYLTLGFVPTLVGFGVGLLLQGLLFEPQDLYHLAVNSLSLMVPLIAVHYSFGRALFDETAKRRLNWLTIVKLDAAYYAGVTCMVGFWLMIGEVETPFHAWLAFAGSYLFLVALEPVVTWLIVKGLKPLEARPWVARLSSVGQLTV